MFLMPGSRGVKRLLFASRPQMQTGVSLINPVTPGEQKFHPGHPKAWLYASQSAGSYSLAAFFGVASLVKTGTGRLTVTWSAAFLSTNYAALFALNEINTGFQISESVTSRSTSSILIDIRNASGTNQDSGFSVVAFGTLA